MSGLYNQLFGVNPYAGVLLQALNVNPNDVPRFRDCFLSDDGKDIVIYTRTGGGNRAFYESEQSCRENYPEYFKGAEAPTGPWNDDLRKLPGFKSDEDDSYDSTYAYFRFEIPAAFKEQIELLKDLGAVSNPGQRWQELLEKMSKGDQGDPEVQRALRVGEQLLGPIMEALKGQESKAS